MTIQECIKKLSEFPPDYTVKIFSENAWDFIPANFVGTEVGVFDLVPEKAVCITVSQNSENPEIIGGL